jgi:type 1 glutamine amidotransferase
MSKISRRSFIGSAVAGVGLPAVVANSVSLAQAEPLQTQSPRHTGKILRVQYTTGGHTVPIQSFAMFTSELFRDLETTCLSHPDAFRTLNMAGSPDVVVLYDGGGSILEYEAKEKTDIQKYLDAGKGLVILHHAICNNQYWPFWYEQVAGGALFQHGVDGMKRGRLKQFPHQVITPVGDHPIVKGLEPFVLSRDEVFVDMWVSPKITPLFRSSDPDLGTNNVIGWIGVHPKARVAFLQSGHTPFVCADPRYHEIVHRMILWAGGKLA